MKIATYNINNINKRLRPLLAWLDATRPDVVCLQELKAADEAFPRDALSGAGYGAVWRGQKSWNGVAILARDCEPVLTRSDLPGDLSDIQARYIEAAVGGILIASLYAPNGNPRPGPKFDYKLAWMERLLKHAASVQAAGVPAVLAGDYNVAPTEQDIYPNNSYAENALVQPEPRAQFRRLLAQGWRDALREKHPRAPMYTFWDYRRNRWPRDAGLRLDHLLLSASLAPRLLDAGVDREVRALQEASDHAPAWITLGTVSRRSASARKASAPPRAKRVKRPLLAIDGDSFAHRAYHALPKNIRKSDGSPAGAILGFANMLLKLYQAEQPRAVVVAWDTLEKPTYRHRAFPAYQGGRVFDDDLLAQFSDLRAFVGACGFANARAPGYEADDFLAAAAAAEQRRGGQALIASGDRDTFQLATDRCTILFPVRAGVMQRIGPEEVRARYGVEPRLVPDFIALRGDPSDKLPGAPGVGAKTAADLLGRYGSLENTLAQGRFAAQADQLRLFRSIATMNVTAPLASLATQQPNWKKASGFASRWGLNALANRLEELAAAAG